MGLGFRILSILKQCWTACGASGCAARANLPLEILQFACLKLDQAQRHQYWTFDVGRSMFDVQLSLVASNQ